MGKRKNPNLFVRQQSGFFRLPAELRNQIYEETIDDIESASLRGDVVLYAPPLSLVCRQIRLEYENIYLDGVLSHATDYHIHTTNFVCKGAVIRQIQDLLRQGNQKVTFHVYLTNMYDQYRLDMRQLIEGSPLRSKVPAFPYLSPEYGISVRWNPDSFDVDFLQQTIRKLNWYYGTSHAMYGAKTKWPKVRGAFEEAIRRYQPNQAPKSPPRNRASGKRRTKPAQSNTPERLEKRRKRKL